MTPVSDELKSETIKVMDVILSEFGEKLPDDFSKRVLKLSDIYFHNNIDGINMWYELCAIVSRAEKGISSVEETKREFMTLRNFIVLTDKNRMFS